MGWGRLFLLGNVGQQMDIEELRSGLRRMRRNAAAHSAISAQKQAEVLQGLEAENAELKLYLAALVRLLVAKGVVSADELRQVVEAVDAEDGQADGRLDGKVV